MEKFSLNIFFSKIQRLPFNVVKDMVDENLEAIQKLSIVDANQILNLVERKMNIVLDWQEHDGMVDLLTFKMIAKRIPDLSRYTFEEIENINKLNPNIQVELAYLLKEEEKMNLLNNFGSKLIPLVVQEFILALNKENQRIMMLKFKKQILAGEDSLLPSFLATLDKENQIIFLDNIKEQVKAMDASKFMAIVLGVLDSNMESFFKSYYDLINGLDDSHLLNFLTVLSGEGVVLFNQYFSERIEKIPADIFMYKLGTGVEDEEQIYHIWANNGKKLSELSDNYFNLVVSRLDDTSRLNSLTDFKERYNKMDGQQLLDLFELDYDEYKLKLFMEYQHKINGLDDKVFVKYVNDNISSSELRNQIFLAYKDKICKMSDENFIYFVKSYSEINLKYSFSVKKEAKKALTDYIITNFGERLKSIQLKNIPKLFSESDSCLQHEYIELLRDNIKKLILDKTYIGDLLTSVWGDSKEEIVKQFSSEFKTLNASDWYALLDAVGNIGLIENYLLSCDVDHFDFIDHEELLNSSKLKRMFYYFELNVQGKLLETYTKLAEDGQKDKLLEMYEELMTKVVDEDTEYILSNYNIIHLLVLLRVLLKYHFITNQDGYYQLFNEMYVSKLLSKLEKENESNVVQVKSSLFYRLIKGGISSASLMSIKTLKGLIWLCRNVVNVTDRSSIGVYTPGEIEKFTVNLTEEQIILLNNKLFKQVCEYILSIYHHDQPSREQVRNLAIKLYMAVGFSNAKRLIDLDVEYTRYEYIFNDIDIKRIHLNENGEPVLNKKLMDFMFGSTMDDENTNINRLLQDKIPEFEQKFAQIYNGWETIFTNLNGNVTVSRILKWFEENKVLLNPDEYRLGEVIGEIGNDERNIEVARKLYGDMKSRKYSTIPKIMGRYNDEYTYEMLDLDNPLGLVVGYITRCCFLINGMSRSSLFHSAQSKDGRIFIVRRNGELIAQSWVWRNGNLVCFDNVEARGNYDRSILLEAYKKASQEIIAISNKNEDTKEQIKLVTFGGGYSKIEKPNEKVPRSKIHTPRVDGSIYTDANYEQFILASNGEEELYYGDVKAQYKDIRSEVQRYSRLSLLEKEKKSSIIRKIREIDYLYYKESRIIDFESYAYAAIADDWYVLVLNNGETECVLLENDERARKEIYDEIDHLSKIFAEMGVQAQANQVGSKVLSFIDKGGEQ